MIERENKYREFIIQLAEKISEQIEYKKREKEYLISEINSITKGKKLIFEKTNKYKFYSS